MTDEITPGFMNYLSELPDNIQWFICDNIKDLSNDNIRVTIANAKTSLPIFLSEYANLEETEKDNLKINYSYFKTKGSTARAIFDTSDASEKEVISLCQTETSEDNEDSEVNMECEKKLKGTRPRTNSSTIDSQAITNTCKKKVL